VIPVGRGSVRADKGILGSAGASPSQKPGPANLRGARHPGIMGFASRRTGWLVLSVVEELDEEMSTEWRDPGLPVHCSDMTAFGHETCAMGWPAHSDLVKSGQTLDTSVHKPQIPLCGRCLRKCDGVQSSVLVVVVL
jgi:hypothetical protein